MKKLTPKVKLRALEAAPPTSPIVAGLDPSLNGFGLCAYTRQPDGSEVYTTARWKPPKMSDIERLAWFYRRLSGWLVDWGPTAIAVEGYAFDVGNSRSHALGELGGVVRLALFEYATSLPALPKLGVIPPTSLKKYVTDNGAAPKDLMLLKTFQMWGAEFNNSDECDAYGLARMMAAIVGVEQPSHAYQRKVLAKLAA